MTETDLRAVALDHAQRQTYDGEGHVAVLDRAKAFLEFLKGKETAAAVAAGVPRMKRVWFNVYHRRDNSLECGKAFDDERDVFLVSGQSQASCLGTFSVEVPE